MSEYEARATEAEKRLDALTSKMAELEGSVGGDAKSLVQNEQLKTLERLRGIRAKLSEEGGGLQQAVRERDEARAEAASLKTQLVKAEYRISILLRSLEEAEKK